MKRILIILIMVETFVGYYDVYSESSYLDLEIRKDKKGNYYLLDYGEIGGSIFANDNTIYLGKLKKNNCRECIIKCVNYKNNLCTLFLFKNNIY